MGPRALGASLVVLGVQRVQERTGGEPMPPAPKPALDSSDRLLMEPELVRDLGLGQALGAELQDGHLSTDCARARSHWRQSSVYQRMMRAGAAFQW